MQKRIQENSSPSKLAKKIVVHMPGVHITSHDQYAELL